MQCVHKVRLLDTKSQILRKKLSIWIERWQVFEPKAKELIKTIGNQGRNCYGDRYRDKSKEHDGDRRRKDDYKEKLAFMFHQRTRTLSLEVREWKCCLQSL